MQMPTVVDMSDLPLIVVGLKGDARVGSGTDGRHSRFWWRNGKAVRRKDGWDPMGYVST